VPELRRQGAKSTVNLGFQFKEKSNGYGKLSALHLSPSVVNGKAHTAIEKILQRGKLQMKNQKTTKCAHSACTFVSTDTIVQLIRS
jgi:hypothetical protein